ncbi:ABC transporter ATP-binding protein [Paenibacillus sp. FSL R7-0345]|uniref:ABC transporter ATP-binding protein n=1 Tax=Paenibacillus sp. FSL R7-0345 TaxID=2954535 RepID=UPI00315A3C40
MKEFDNSKLIEVNKISKVYKIYEKPTDRIKEVFHPLRKKLHRDFMALNDISFSVGKGETVGVLGKNGSGKSTLLKIVTGVLQPTTGEVRVNGKVSALLELGAGFNPELSGIENVYMNGTIMGYSKADMDAKMQSILDFADIGEFVTQPVKSYSSGMFARLAFAVAINVDPDILIVDEALSVGDAHFQEKSFTKMKQFRNEGKTIFFVSHSISSVRNFCDRAIWIENGKIKMMGRAEDVCTEYQDYINEQKEELFTVDNAKPDTSNNKIIIKDVKVNKDQYFIDDDITVSIELEFVENIINYGIGVIIHNTSGAVVTLYNTVRDDIYFEATHKKIVLTIPNNDFVRGKYYVTVSISDELSMFPYDRKDYVAKFSVEAKRNKNGIPIADGMFRSKHQWDY